MSTYFWKGVLIIFRLINRNTWLFEVIAELLPPCDLGIGILQTGMLLKHLFYQRGSHLKCELLALCKLLINPVLDWQPVAPTYPFHFIYSMMYNIFFSHGTFFKRVMAQKSVKWCFQGKAQLSCFKIVWIKDKLVKKQHFVKLNCTSFLKFTSCSALESVYFYG